MIPPSPFGIFKAPKEPGEGSFSNRADFLRGGGF